MKIAVEFYGHLRTFRETADNILEKFIGPLGGSDVDVFIHSWDKTDHSDYTWHNKNCEKRGIDVTEDDINFLQQKYHPKKILIEPQLVIPPEKNIQYDENRDSNYMDNVFYTRYRVNQLRQEYERETGVKYDYVIQARLDLYFYSKADFLERLEVKKLPDIDKMIFYSWTGGDDYYYCYPSAGHGGIDILYFGMPEPMNKLANLYLNLDKIDFKKHYVSHDYILLYNAIRQNMLAVPFNYITHKDYTILRTKQSADWVNANAVYGAADKKGRKKVFWHSVGLAFSMLPIFKKFINSGVHFKKIDKYYKMLALPAAKK